MVVLRSICRAARFRSLRSAAIARHQLRHHFFSRSVFSLSYSYVSAPSNRLPSGYGSHFVLGIGSRRYFSEDVTHLPAMQDPLIERAFKDLMADSWGELHNAVICDVKNALSKNTDDKAGQEILKNVLRAAEAVEEFGDMLMNLKMELDDSIGQSGEDVKPLSNEFCNALRIVFQRYSAYLDSFGPDEAYLKKKVETELGSKMIYLKMRCSGLGSEWGKVTVLGTSGLAGSYVEHRA